MSRARLADAAWRAQALDAVDAWSCPAAEVRVLRAHRRDHLLAVCTTGEERLFVKAFAPDSEGDLRREWSAYRRLAGVPGVPVLHHADPVARVLIIDYVPGGRLGSARGVALRDALGSIPSLYAATTTGQLTVAPAHPEYPSAWARLDGRDECAHLPSPQDVWPIVAAMPARHVHADFQPSNVLLDGNRAVVVDLESYGTDVPALDVARMAYNPVLDLDDGERDALAWAMLGRLEAIGLPPVSRRELAACCVVWAVSCASYFTRVLATQPDALDHSPEAAVLSTEPLRMATRLWHQEV